MQPKKKIGDQANGRWKSILVSLGVDERILDGNHHPCPVSGEGEDRFRFSNYKGKGNFFCACNDGKSDGFKLLECKFGADFPAAAKMVEEVIGVAEEDATDNRTTEHAIADLQMIQDRVKACRTLDAVTAYLEGRGIEREYHPRGTLRQASVNYGLRKIGITKPMTAMVAKVVTADNQPSTFHLTYLGEDNRKAQIERDRVVATPSLPMAGGAVRLYPMGSDGVLGVAEGIETAISARVLFGLPVWATLNAQQMEKFEPPAGCTKVVIFADNDDSFTGQAAAYNLAKKCVLKHKVQAEVKIPLRQGDYNDVLQRGA